MSSLQIGRLLLGAVMTSSEPLGDPNASLGGAVVPAQRTVPQWQLTLATWAADGQLDTLTARLGFRRQLRSLLNNSPLKYQGFLYVVWSDDPEQNGWYVPDQGPLADLTSPVGLATGLWQLQVPWDKAGAARTNREARSVWMKDLRTGLYYRDQLQWIYSTDFSALPALQLSVVPNGASSAIYTVSNQVVQTTALPAGRDGGVCLQASGLPDLACVSYERAESALNASDVIVYDRGGALGPFGTGGAYDSPTGLVNPQSAYGWLEVYGPDWPWSWQTPWSASGGTTVSTPIAHDPADTTTIGTSWTMVIPANAGRQSLEIFNQDPAAVVNVSLGAIPSSTNAGIVINPNNDSWATPRDTGTVFTGAVYLISNTAGTVVSWSEV